MTNATRAPMAIRHAIESDYEKLQDLLREFDRHYARLLPGDSRALRQARPRRLILDWIADRKGLLLVCEKGGVIAGCLRATLERTSASPKASRALEVHDLIVARRMRNAGIGSALMAEAEAWARRHRARRVRLEVPARSHEAVSFCDELGFEALTASLEKRI